MVIGFTSSDGVYWTIENPTVFPSVGEIVEFNQIRYLTTRREFSYDEKFEADDFSSNFRHLSENIVFYHVAPLGGK